MGDKIEPDRTRSTFKPSEETLLGLESLLEPTFVDEAFLDTELILAMQEELNQFSRKDVWNLVPKPRGIHVIGTKWVFKTS